MLVVPSPKSHSLEVIEPSDALLKLTVNGARPDSISTEKVADGGIGVAVGAGASCSIRDGALVEDTWPTEVGADRRCCSSQGSFTCDKQGRDENRHDSIIRCFHVHLLTDSSGVTSRMITLASVNYLHITHLAPKRWMKIFWKIRGGL